MRIASLVLATVLTGLCGCDRKTEPAAVATPSPATSSAEPPAVQVLPGPIPGTRMTEAYARMVIRDTYFWAWPMVNIYNRRLAFEQAPKAGLMNGVLPFAPLNTLSMLHDYIAPEQRWVACPNQDVVYGAAIEALEKEPVVVQIPDFAGRFWVYQVIDLRTDGFAELGAMYDTEPGFYLLAHQDWKGTVPEGITKVFRSHTATAMIVPRVFQDDTAQDRQAVQPLIAQIDVYPLSAFDGKMKQHDWSQLPNLGSPTAEGDAGETRWVFPDKFLDQLPAVLKDASPLPGEEARYALVQSLLDAAAKDPALKTALTDEVVKAEKELIDPLLQFRNFGIPLPHHWTTEKNGAAFGSDYFMRTAIAKSNILVNKANETLYFYQDLNESGARLNSRKRHTVTFAKDQFPPVKGFWSLTLYDEHHFFVPNQIKRYSLGTKNKDLQLNADGSLTIYVQSEPPSDPALRTNWLPAPKSADFTLYLRAYWPDTAIISGAWTPPPVRIAQ